MELYIQQRNILYAKQSHKRSNHICIESETREEVTIFALKVKHVSYV